MSDQVTITERGWPGHFICSHQCTFRRNTLVQFGKKRIVVSTVGCMRNELSNAPVEIGWQRFYETMVFQAKYESPYWDTNCSKEMHWPESPDWRIDHCEKGSDLQANNMHEAWVAFVAERIKEKLPH
jgi:hypothetical protein